ncbi:hypothetical protein LZ30DRAFT_764297 [Colletotrichum cereale]|nr:hypothetical protein LZ30DRAFT_764297 [Colletotrichum cereale]
MSDDGKDQTLLQLSRRYRASIISQLVDIGNDCNQQEHVKFLSFISSLECLQLKGSELYRRSINAFHQRRWDDEYFRFSQVRKYIDAHCIRQETCGVNDCARHSRCVKKRNAIQAMDLVYQLSEHPVALLGRPLRTGSELHLLARILSGDLLDDNREFRLREKTFNWCRAWTFQENYRGGRQMQLLIRHDPSLELQKRRYKPFGEIPNELCILSMMFSTQATRLCLALRGVTGLPSLGMNRIDGVLRAAGRYTLMVHSSRSMTPTVIADIEAPNCCQYPVRLDGGALSRQGRSLSLSVLAICLLNGKILNNRNNDMASVAKLTASEFLDRFMFRQFKAPKDETRQLTFNKGSRLTDVELTAGGITTRGHLWKLGPVIDTARRKLPQIDKPRGRLTLYERRALLQLVFHLYDIDCRWLADRIDKYLAANAHAKKEYRSFTKIYLHRMATELAAAVLAHRKLRLGSIWGKSEGPALYRALFVWSDQGGDRAYPPVAFAFTSAWQGDPGSQTHDANDIDRHVSLGVEKRSLGSGGVPQLRVRRWLLGMCFFDGCPLTKVVFPWPRALQVVNQ